MHDFATTVEIMSRLGIAGVFLLVIVALIRGWLVTGREYMEMRRERDEWKRVALKGTVVAEKAVDVAKDAAKGEAERLLADSFLQQKGGPK